MLLPGGSAPNTVHIVSRGIIDSISAFGEATYCDHAEHASDQRCSLDERPPQASNGLTDRVNRAGAVFAHLINTLDWVTYDEVTFRAALRQDLSDKVNLYASINRSFKAGEFNLQIPQDPAGQARNDHGL